MTRESCRSRRTRRCVRSPSAWSSTGSRRAGLRATTAPSSASSPRRTSSARSAGFGCATAVRSPGSSTDPMSPRCARRRAHGRRGDDLSAAYDEPVADGRRGRPSHARPACQPLAGSRRRAPRRHRHSRRPRPRVQATRRRDRARDHRGGDRRQPLGLARRRARSTCSTARYAPRPCPGSQRRQLLVRFISTVPGVVGVSSELTWKTDDVAHPSPRHVATG